MKMKFLSLDLDLASKLLIDLILCKPAANHFKPNVIRSPEKDAHCRVKFLRTNYHLSSVCRL